MASGADNTQRKRSSGRTSSKRKSIPPEQLLASLRKAKETLQADSSAELLPVLRKAGVRSPLVLAGSQHVRAKRTIDWIREQFFSNCSSSTSSYFGSELSSKKAVEPLLLSLGSPSLFSKESLLIIYNADSVKSAAAKELAEAVLADSDNTLVVLTAEDISKKTSLPGLLLAECTLVEISELQGPTLRKWLEREARRCGAAGLADDAAELLIKYCGADTTLLAREINKLALLGAPEVPINRALVEQISFHSPGVNSFGLIQRLARKDARGSVTLAHTLMDQGMHPMQISYFLSRCFRTLLAHVDSVDKQTLAPELTNFWFVKQLGSSMRAFSRTELVDCIELLKQLDFQLKDSRLRDSLAMSLILQRIALRQLHAKSFAR